jgi:hypothetical protein
VTKTEINLSRSLKIKTNISDTVIIIEIKASKTKTLINATDIKTIRIKAKARKLIR